MTPGLLLVDKFVPKIFARTDPSKICVIIAIVNRGCQAIINVEKPVGTTPKLLAFYVKAGPNLVDITCVDKRARKLL